MGAPDAATGEPTARRYLRDLAAGERRRLRFAVLAGTSVGLLTIAQLVLLAGFVSRLLVDGASLPELTPLLGGLLAVLPLRALAL